MNKNLKIVEKSKYFFLASALLIILGIVLLFVEGMNLGLDFTEGANITINYFESTLNDSNGENFGSDEAFKNKVKEKIEEFGFTIGGEIRMSDAGDYSVLEIGLKYEFSGEQVDSEKFAEFINNQEGGGLIKDLTEYLSNDLKVEISGEILHNVTTADATKPLIKSAIWAIVIAIIAMLVYIIIRFTLVSGISAVLVLIHDVLIMITLTVLFRVQVNTTFIAAIVTVIGYSINATIVVFDRIKEYLKSGVQMSDSEIANSAIRDTFKRTLLTTATTLITIILLTVFSSAIREFTLPIIFGLLSGVYSAMVLSSCVWLQIRKIEKLIVGKNKKGYDKYAKDKEEA